MPDMNAHRLEMIASARLRVAIDHRLGRPTPPEMIKLSLSADDLDAEASRLTAPASRQAEPASQADTRRRHLVAALPALPLLVVIVLEAWWRADSLVPLLVAIIAAAVAGALPVYLLCRLLSAGAWSTTAPTVLTGTWLGLVPGPVGDKLGASTLGTAVIGAVVAVTLISVLGHVQTAIELPRFAARSFRYSERRPVIGLHPFMRYGLAAAGFGTGVVLYSVLTGWPASASGFDLGVSVVTCALTALACTIAVIGVPLAMTLTRHRPPLFGPVPLVPLVLLTLWQLAAAGNVWWQLTGCVIALGATGGLGYLVRRHVLVTAG